MAGDARERGKRLGELGRALREKIDGRIREENKQNEMKITTTVWQHSVALVYSYKCPRD